MSRRAPAAFLLLLVSACGEAGSALSGSVVFGVTSDFEPGPDIGRLRADMRAGDAVSSREWALGGARELRFPIELPFTDLPDGTPLEVTLSAYEGISPGAAPFLTRTAATSIEAGSDLLLRAHLEWECVPSFHLGGGLLAPTCDPPDTCVAAACEDPYLPPQQLEPYARTWAVDFGDECRPLGAGDAEVEIGQGTSEFSPLSPGGAVQMMKGPQGGYHVWLALRARSLHRVGSVTTVSIRLTSTGEELCTETVPWDFAPSGAGACDLPGIQCVVSYGLLGADALAGQEADVSAKVVDSTGNVALAQQVITLVAP